MVSKKLHRGGHRINCPFPLSFRYRASAQFLSTFFVVFGLPLRAAIYIAAALSLGREHHQRD